jgi:hypothetical protein
VQVLKLEVQTTKDSNARGVAAATNLSMNQTLEGHHGVFNHVLHMVNLVQHA